MSLKEFVENKRNTELAFRPSESDIIPIPPKITLDKMFNSEDILSAYDIPYLFDSFKYRLGNNIDYGSDKVDPREPFVIGDPKDVTIIKEPDGKQIVEIRHENIIVCFESIATDKYIYVGNKDYSSSIRDDDLNKALCGLKFSVR